MRQGSVTVIIPAHTPRYGLRETLEALQQQTYSGPVQVLVGNDGDLPQVRELCQSFGVEAVPSVPAGSSYRARNAALQRATGDVIAFTDSNKVPRQDWLEAGMAALEKTGADYLAGRVLVIPRSRQPDLAYHLQNLTSFPCQHYLEDLHFGVTGNLFAKRSLFEAIGPFDSSLVSGGDFEWGQRAFRAGSRQAYEEGAVVTIKSRSARDLAQKGRRVSHGHMTLALQKGVSIRRQLPWRALAKELVSLDESSKFWTLSRKFGLGLRLGLCLFAKYQQLQGVWYLVQTRWRGSLWDSGFYEGKK